VQCNEKNKLDFDELKLVSKQKKPLEHSMLLIII
jgi:hypothetical protein